MNGVNEVQSSSMCQQRNYTVMRDVNEEPSPSSSLEQQQSIMSIIEELNEEQLPPMASSPLVAPQPSSNRILSEISVSVTNTPIAVIVNKKPVENTLRDSGIPSDQVGGINFV